MKRYLLRILATLSLLLALLLSSGYGVSTGFVVLHAAGPGMTAPQGAWDVTFGEGRVRVLYAGGGSTLGQTTFGWHRPTFRRPDLERSLSAFDAHLLASQSPLWVPAYYLIGFPLWCLIGPLLILPAIVLRRRMRERRREPRGFAVDTATVGTSPT